MKIKSIILSDKQKEIISLMKSNEHALQFWEELDIMVLDGKEYFDRNEVEDLLNRKIIRKVHAYHKDFIYKLTANGKKINL